MNHKLNTCLTLIVILACTIIVDAKERIPFRMEGNLLLIKAKINGQTGEFILDTGAPDLIVNKAHFKTMLIPWANNKIVDFQGHASKAHFYTIDEFTIGEMPIRKQYALSVDLSSIERAKKTHLLGIIGYSVLKDLELLLDFDRQELTIVSVRGKGYEPIMKEKPTATFDLRINDHIPYLVAFVGKKKFRLGLDTGAEINVLDTNSQKHLKGAFDEIKKLQVKGISHNRKVASTGVLKNMTIGNRQTGPMDVTLVSLKAINKNLTFKLDGLLGIPFLKKGKVGLNYKKRKLHFWPSKGTLVNDEVEREFEVSLEE